MFNTNPLRKVVSLLVVLLLPMMLFGQHVDARRPPIHPALITPPKTLPEPLSWVDIREAHLINSSTGWVLLGNKLLWTDTDGANFNDITPPVSEEDRIVAVEFFDAMNGWVVINRPRDDNDDNENAITIMIAATSNGGKSWILAPVELDDYIKTIYVGDANLSFVSPEVGFGNFQMSSSSASTQGFLVRTFDGGRTWKFVSYPGYGKLHFLSPDIGWIQGSDHSGDSGLIRTTDGGVTWKDKTPSFPAGVEDVWRIVFEEPSFLNLQDATLEAFYELPSKPNEERIERIAHYSTVDGGDTWKLESTVAQEAPRKAPRRALTMRMLDHSNPPEVFFDFSPFLVIRTSTSEHRTFLPFASSQTNNRPWIDSADFSDPMHGWIVVKGGHSALISTSDGGAHLKTLLMVPEERTGPVPAPPSKP